MYSIGIIGLGYVGLPLAVEFGKKYQVTGFDINKQRIRELEKGCDRTREVEPEDLKQAEKLQFTESAKGLAECNHYSVTVPTPIDEFKKPDLKPLMKASKAVGKLLKKGDIVIYESTVYPGCTEEVCVPILEEKSGLKYNKDFFVGYSPERINPGDKEHRLTNIKKVTSGSNEETAEKVDRLYKSIVTAGTHKASSIKVAEAAKVIENAQRDLNIAFVNDLSLIFDKIGIDTLEVLEAAGTKWNFLPFRPGLVGGHCIGVDPYYLTHKAEAIGYHPQVILAGRRINDNMGIFIANKLVKLLNHNGHTIKGSKVLMLGITFKENCPDIRNSKVIDVIRELESFGITVEVYDPLANAEEVNSEYGIDLIGKPNGKYNATVLAVGHDCYKKVDLEALNGDRGVVFDIKGYLERSLTDARL